MHIVRVLGIAQISSLVLLTVAAGVRAGTVDLVSATGTLTATIQPASGAPITKNFDITYDTLGDDIADANDQAGNQAGLNFRHEGLNPTSPGHDFPLLLTASWILAGANGGSANVSGAINIVTDRQLDYELSIVSFEGDRILSEGLDGDTINTDTELQPHHDGPLAPGTHLFTFNGATRTNTEAQPFASGDFQLALFPAGDILPPPPPSGIPLPMGLYGGLTLFTAAAFTKRRLKLGATH
jgi:hypothetical protein